MNTVTYDRESRLRSLLKAFSWRILATLTTVIIAWIITKKVDASILKHLDTFELGKLPERELRLLYLTFSLIEVYTAVEWYKQPQVVDGYASERLVPVQEMQLDGTTWRGR
ncbi:MAG: DUF2061 domain-containing protein [Pseudomonadota bacterium]|nr:DUF2061 domain-containing protein [Pseudomonadota bacterium]